MLSRRTLPRPRRLPLSRRHPPRKPPRRLPPPRYVVVNKLHTFYANQSLFRPHPRRPLPPRLPPPRRLHRQRPPPQRRRRLPPRVRHGCSSSLPTLTYSFLLQPRQLPPERRLPPRRPPRSKARLSLALCLPRPPFLVAASSGVSSAFPTFDFLSRLSSLPVFAIPPESHVSRGLLTLCRSWMHPVGCLLRLYFSCD
jgi:hypothetical protein